MLHESDVVLQDKPVVSNSTEQEKTADEGLQAKVQDALENPNFVWRTVEGLVKDTELSENTVLQVLHNMPTDTLVTTTGRQGRLFTTRQHYDNKQSFLGKFLSAASGTLK